MRACVCAYVHVSDCVWLYICGVHVVSMQVDNIGNLICCLVGNVGVVFCVAAVCHRSLRPDL